MSLKRQNKRTITIVACYFGPKLGVGVFMEKLLEVLIPKLLNNSYFVNLVTNKTVLSNSPSLYMDHVNIVQPRLINRSLFSKFYFLYIFSHLKIVKFSDSVLFMADSIVAREIKQATCIVHDLNEFEFESKFGRIRTFFRKKMINQVMKYGEKIIVISNFVKQQVCRNFPEMENDKRLSVIHSGITIKKKDQASAVKKENENPYFLIVGRVDPEGKKLYEAVKIFLSWQKNHPEYTLKIVGSTNKFCEESGNKFIQYTAGIKGIEYLGYVDDETLDSLYTNAWATIFFSQFEGFGFPVLEAFLRGCPVITNRDNEVNSELSSGMDIKISESEIGNDQLINEKLAQVDNIQKEKLIDIANKFSWEATADKYFKILDEN